MSCFQYLLFSVKPQDAQIFIKDACVILPTRGRPSTELCELQQSSFSLSSSCSEFTEDLFIYSEQEADCC